MVAKRLGREFYYAKHDDDDSVEISRYEEKAKKTFHDKVQGLRCCNPI